MKFEDFIKSGQARRAEVDAQLAKALVATARNDMAFLRTLKINSVSARKIVSGYYDIIRSLLEADAILSGFKIYSHEALTFYLESKGDVTGATKFDRFRKIRNGINYYGKEIDAEEARDVVKDMLDFINSIIPRFKGTGGGRK
jgi:hypothetical protein